MRFIAGALAAVLLLAGAAFAQPVHSRAASPTTASAPTTPANEFKTEAEAKAHCSSGNVVWMNTRSKVYHFAGTREFGKTKRGAYMCQADADRIGRAAKNEKPPAH
jgi:hypothetical protein